MRLRSENFTSTLAGKSQTARFVSLIVSLVLAVSLNQRLARGEDPCQWEWRAITGASFTTAHAMHDQGIGRSVIVAATRYEISLGRLLRDSVVREWTGSDWKRTLPQGEPSQDLFSSFASAYDSRRARVLIFGGQSSSGTVVPIDDFRQWDGVRWTSLSPLSRPGPRKSALMAYDPIRDRIVLYGGIVSGSTHVDQTWVFDGSNWTQLPIIGPGLPSSMWYDETRQAIQLATTDANLWEFDGAQWSKTIALPTTGSTWFGDFDGTTSVVIKLAKAWNSPPSWNPLYSAPPAGALANGLFPVALNRSTGQIVSYISGLFNSTEGLQQYVWQSGNWTLLSQNPGAIYAYGFAWDSQLGEIVSFGGRYAGNAISSSYRLHGDHWEAFATGTPKPSVRYFHAMSSDRTHGTIVVFGGTSGSNRFADTWILKNGQWSSPAGAGPSARSSTCMSDDTNRGKVVLFGGINSASAYLNDTWEWDGAAWQNRNISGPPVRAASTMCFDPTRNVHILFGGSASTTLYDTWEYDGTQWMQFNVTGPPVIGGTLAFHPTMGCPILVGTDSTFGTSGVWAWKSGQWFEIPTPGLHPSAGTFMRSSTHWQNGTVCVWNPAVGTGPGLVDTVYELVAATPLSVTINVPHTTVRKGESVLLGAMPTTTGPFDLTWARNATDLADGPQPSGSELWNAKGRTLSIVHAQAADAGNYSVTVADSCFVASASVEIVITCANDIDRDGLVDDTDFQSFIQAYNALLCPFYCPFDTNADRIVDDADFISFVQDYNALVCN